MARKPPGRKAAALGAELRVIRERLDRSMHDVASGLGWSDSMLSRLETGKRNIDVEEVAALLTVYDVTGPECDRLMTMANSPDESSWLDLGLPGLATDSLRLASYEADAIAIIDWSPLLVPGLLQTMEYTRAFMLEDDIPESTVGARLMARQRRQEILSRVRYTAYLDESVLRREVGGAKVLRGQIQRLIEIAQDGSATIRITPASTGGHAGLTTPFLDIERVDGQHTVCVELARSGVFFTGLDSEVYVATVGRLDTLALDSAGSLRLLTTAAGAIGSDSDGKRDLA